MNYRLSKPISEKDLQPDELYVPIYKAPGLNSSGGKHACSRLIPNEAAIENTQLREQLAAKEKDAKGWRIAFNAVVGLKEKVEKQLDEKDAEIERLTTENAILKAKFAYWVEHPEIPPGRRFERWCEVLKNGHLCSDLAESQDRYHAQRCTVIVHEGEL